MGWAAGAAVGVTLPIGGITDGITDALTGAIGDAGVYAVFLLMLVDAVLPAGSEIVMLYAGALAAGAFPDSRGDRSSAGTIEPGITAYVVMALAGTLGYLLGSILGWGIGRYGGQPLLERHGRWFHVTPEKLAARGALVPALRDLDRVRRPDAPGRSVLRLDPGRDCRGAAGAVHALTFLGTLPWCFGIAGAGYLLGERWETFHDQLPLDRLRDHRADRARDRVPDRPRVAPAGPAGGRRERGRSRRLPAARLAVRDPAR